MASTRCFLPVLVLSLFALLTALFVCPDVLSAEETNKTVQKNEIEGKLDPFLGDPGFKMQQVFKGERFPNVVVAMDGTVVASWGSSTVRVRRSDDGGKTWGDEIVVAKPGFQGGGLTVDETTGDILLFAETHHPPAKINIFRSRDHGKTWQQQETKIEKTAMVTCRRCT